LEPNLQPAARRPKFAPKNSKSSRNSARSPYRAAATGQPPLLRRARAAAHREQAAHRVRARMPETTSNLTRRQLPARKRRQAKSETSRRARIQSQSRRSSSQSAAFNQRTIWRFAARPCEAHSPFQQFPAALLPHPPPRKANHRQHAHSDNRRNCVARHKVHRARSQLEHQ
jgi:hypothetical protein